MAIASATRCAWPPCTAQRSAARHHERLTSRAGAGACQVARRRPSPSTLAACMPRAALAPMPFHRRGPPCTAQASPAMLLNPCTTPAACRLAQRRVLQAHSTPSHRQFHPGLVQHSLLQTQLVDQGRQVASLAAALQAGGRGGRGEGCSLCRVQARGGRQEQRLRSGGMAVRLKGTPWRVQGGARATATAGAMQCRHAHRHVGTSSGV